MTELNQTAEIAVKFQLKEEVVKRYKVVFDEYDKEQEGNVQVKDLPAIFKTLRGTITESEGISVVI
jgi:Ca2+-binding EF-hand superfamily protein